jgi:hypothetical protein
LITKYFLTYFYAKLDKQDYSSISLNVKIKIYSTWTNAKNIILQGIRLRYFLEQGHVDVLQSLLPKVQSGLSTLQQSNEVIRSLPMLIGQGVRLNGAMWKAPISSENPIEIVFEGVLSQNLMGCMTSDSKPFDKTKLELLMWNGAIGGVLANSSPAKDVDVFVDNKCIWSGEIPEESQISEISRASEKPVAPSKFEGKPSARLKLVPAPRVGSAVGSQKLQVNPVETKKSSPTRSLIKSTIASPERILKSDFASRGDPSIPEWLRGSKVVERKASVLDSPLKTSRIEELESDKHEEEFGEFTRISNGSPVANRSAAKSRRRRPRDAAIVSSAEIDGESSIQYSTPMNRQESDSNLRKSMEAVQHAEKFNLNRLESTLSKRRPRRSSNAGDVNYEDSFDGNQAGESFQIPEQSNSPSKSLDSMIARNGDSGLPESSNVEFSKTLDFEASGTSKVSNKINDVNLKLNNALTDLAEIMASLPRNRSEKRIKPIPLLNVPNDSKSRTESPLKPASILAENSTSTAYDGNQGLPIGTTLRIQIFSTYGDMNYVGLNGLEIFDDQGKILTLGQSIISIQAQPSDLGVLPGYGDDPRKVTNLLDGVNTTKDDLHQWLAPHMAIAREYHPGLNSFMFPDNDEEPLAVITIQFKVKQAVSMIRVYNFNKSRTHNQRGVKNCRFYLDSTLIYEG